MKQIWEENFNDLYRNFEDMQNHCAYLESENNQLQSNWNSLRKCVIGVIEEARDELNTIIHTTDIHTTEGLEYINLCSKEFEVIQKNLKIVLDKMNELEGNDKQ